jgi:glycosyltransferase involved in cell wall biosynthesis
MGIKAYMDEQKRIRQNWKEILKNNQDAIENYDSECRYYGECLNKRIEKKVLYESAKGERQFQALSALFECFVNRPDFKEYLHVWVFHKWGEYRILKKKYEQHKNVKFFVIKDEVPKEYYENLATAKYLFHGGNFPYYFVKREEQVYLSIREMDEKRMLFLENNMNSYRAANHMHNLLLSDFVLTGSQKACDLLKKAFKLKGIYEGRVLIADAQKQAGEILQTVLDQKDVITPEGGFETEKKKLLFYGTGLAMNGVTEALLALLKKIDYDRYDVTVCCRLRDGIYSQKNLERIDPNVRVLVSRGTDPMTEEEYLAALYLKKHGISGREEEKLYHKNRRLFKRAALRMTGNTSYDCVIDFSGYAVWMPLLLLEVPAKKRLIWQHQDLKEDFKTINNGKLKHLHVNIEGVTSLYPKFDKIVAVNRPLMEINREKLGCAETEGRFCYATNIIDKERLDEKISGIEADSILTDANGRKYLVADSERSSVDGMIKMFALDKEEGQFDFVTIGRLSQEKNHLNLILAFQEFLKEYPKSRLFIVGKGVLLEELQTVAAREQLEKHVIFTGNLTNPFLLMKHCDCFVFPSYFEGQGLVVLEARILGMPIVMSDYGVAESVCVPDGQYLTGMEKEDILKGLFAFVQGEVPKNYTFDLEAYNRNAIEEFYRVLED